MPADEGLSFILFAFEQETDSLLYQRWLIGGQFSMSFDEFKEKLVPAPQKSEQAIIDDVQSILDAFDKERGRSQ